LAAGAFFAALMQDLNGGPLGWEEILFPRSATLPLPLVPQIDHLPDVMLHVRGTLHDHVQAVRGVRAHPGVFF